MPDYTHVEVMGEVSVKRHQGKIMKRSYRVLVVGPTGAGKSAFIEALAGVKLGISKDQLDGYTDSITAYEVLGMRHERYRDPIHIIDTPGFNDTSITEVEIIEGVKGWMKEHRLAWVNHILYLYPITSPRLPASHRKVIAMLKTLVRAGQFDPESSGMDDGTVSIGTTMWDTISTERCLERAEAHFAQLRDEIWKDMIAQGALMARFLNTQQSAIQIIDEGITRCHQSPYFAYQSNLDESSPHKCAYGAHLYQALLERLENARQQRRTLKAELRQPATHIGSELHSLVRRQLEETEAVLEKLYTQLTEFGGTPSGFEDVDAIPPSPSSPITGSNTTFMFETTPGYTITILSPDAPELPMPTQKKSIDGSEASADKWAQRRSHSTFSLYLGNSKVLSSLKGLLDHGYQTTKHKARKLMTSSSTSS